MELGQPIPLEADVAEVASRLSIATQEGPEALSLALLSAASIDASTLRRAIEYCLSVGGGGRYAAGHRGVDVRVASAAMPRVPVQVAALSGRPIALVRLPAIGDRCHYDRGYSFRSLGSFGRLPRLSYVKTSNEDRHTPAAETMWSLEVSAPVQIFLNFRSEGHAERGGALEWLARDGCARPRA